MKAYRDLDHYDEFVDDTCWPTVWEIDALEDPSPAAVRLILALQLGERGRGGQV